MNNRQLSQVLWHIRKLAGDGNATDRQLLHRFATQREEAAFEMLVGRHGPAVLGLCRRLLRQEQDAEDVFQATFLTLARKASSIRKPESLGCWLYGIASRLAFKVRASNARRRISESVRQPKESSAGKELCAALDEELNRLAWRYRAPMVLCYLEGRTRDEAARQLGWSLGDVVRLCDAATGKPILEMQGLPNFVMSVRFAADGKRLLTNCWGGQSGCWDPLTGEQRSALKGPPEGFAGRAAMLLGTALSTDGTKAALVDARGVLHVWDPATRKVWCRISEPPVGQDQADFSPDGKVLVVKHRDDVIRLWDAVTGKMRCSLPQFGTRRFPHPHAFSPDGRVLATAPSSQDKSIIRLWKTATGKEIGKLIWPDSSSPTCLTFSPDSKYLVAAHHRWGMDTMVGPNDLGLRLWDLATGRDLRRFHAPAGDIRAVVISPDGKTLAAGANDTIILWELATGKERGRFTGHGERIWSLDFSSDGRQLASGSLDHTALVWDMTGLSADGKRFTRALRPEEIERLWAELSNEDGIRAYRAMWKMVAAARPSVTFLAERLRAKEPVADDRLRRLIADLDGDQFKVRTEASRELEELGELAETAVRKTIAVTCSLEARRRLEILLQKIEARILSPKELLTLRALEVLEHIGTPEAKQILHTLASGTPEARLTEEATASLERLARRP